MICLPHCKKTNWIFVFFLVFFLTHTVSAASGSNTVTVFVKDAGTRERLNDAQVYLDGRFRGVTISADEAGILVIPDVRQGTHTVRVTRSGYEEVTKTIVYPEETIVEILLSKGKLIHLDLHESTPHAITIIFYPSSTSYNCTDHVNVSAPLYITNQTRFKDDVMHAINQTFLNLDQYTSPSHPLPDEYREHFNFYYYYDPSLPADAFSGCAGSIPEGYWSEVPFSDLTIILYPTYYGSYTDSSCEPTGCYQNFGSGRALMKAPADRMMLLKHETGHALFELIDTYCGTTYYNQNNPYPNVWASPESCRADARSNNRDPEQCRQIRNEGYLFSSCIKAFWKWDPAPDIMTVLNGGKFGNAATQRMNYVLSQSGSELP